MYLLSDPVHDKGTNALQQGRAVSSGHLWQRVRKAWEKLGKPPRQQVEPGRARAPNPKRADDAPEVMRAGFADEALPWLDTVYAFALRLTRGDQDAADDLVQETFMNAYRSWHTFERGSNA